jgi:hypothetical protein
VTDGLKDNMTKIRLSISHPAAPTSYAESSLLDYSRVLPFTFAGRWEFEVRGPSGDLDEATCIKLLRFCDKLEELYPKARKLDYARRSHGRDSGGHFWGRGGVFDVRVSLLEDKGESIEKCVWKA